MTGTAGMQQPDGQTMHRVFLMAGSIYVAERPTLITTVLGSCIAVCLWDSVRHVGGMNHFVLPETGDGDADRSARYGDVAIERLMNGLLRLGCRIENLQAKVFGGAAVLPFGVMETTVGARNLQVALERLKYYGVPVVAHRTGGERGLLIYLNTETGEVTLRKVAAAGEPNAGAAARKPTSPSPPTGRDRATRRD